MAVLAMVRDRELVPLSGVRAWYYRSESELPTADESDAAPRSWYYTDADGTPLNFDELYSRYDGTVLYRSDCGSQLCGNASCCHSVGPDSFIFFLPGELEYHRSMKPGIPFQQVAPGFPDRLHCDGNSGCIYDKRPLDCRSYPYFPAVKNGVHEGYFDLRRKYGCPLSPQVELRDHLSQIHIWWSKLLKRNDVLAWAEKMGEVLQDFGIEPCPTLNKETKRNG